MDEQRFVISDDVWGRLRPLLPGKPGDSGATAKTIGCFWRLFYGWCGRGCRGVICQRHSAIGTACSGVSEDGLKPEFSSLFSER